MGQNLFFPLYEELGTETTKGFANNFEKFTDDLLQLFKTQKQSVKKMDSVFSKLYPEVAESMSDVEKLGWTKLWDEDKELAERLFISVKANPALRTKISTYAIIDPNTPKSIERLEKLLGGEGFMGITSSQMSRTLQHILSKGGDDWVQLPVLLTKLEGLGAPSTKFVETVLTQPRLTHLLKSGDDAATTLYSSWNKYFYGGGNKLGQTFVDFAEGAVKKVGNNLQSFVKKSLSEKLADIDDIWKKKYPVLEMLDGRSFFEEMMGHYRYLKPSGWSHTGDISEFFKGVDFYKGTTVGNNIFAETAVSMKTTITTDVEKWLASAPIKKNIEFLEQGWKNANGLESNGMKMFFDKAEIHIFMPRANITKALKKTWMDKLNTVNPKIKFEIKALEEFIQ